MNFNVKNIFLFCSAALLLASCGLGLINIKNSTPEKAGKYPAFTIKDSLKGFCSAARGCFDVKHYQLNLTIDPGKKTIGGDVGLTFSVVSNTKEIQLDLDPQFKLFSITEGDDTLRFTRKYSAVYVQFRNELQAGSQHTIKVHYSGKPKVAAKPPWEGGFVWKKDKDGNPWCAVTCETDGSQTWLPIKGYLGDEPDSVTAAFSVPKNLVCVSNGRLCDTVTKGDWKTFTWRHRYPVNPYNITLYVGNFKKFSKQYTAADSSVVEMDFYVLPYHLEKAKEHFKQARTTLNVFEYYFGVYPWVRDGYKLVESPYEGMEHQTAIAYGSGFKNDKRFGFDYIVVHETAHEWWGNAISCGDFKDAWLHEGFATYAEALFVEKTKGYSEYLDYIKFQHIFVQNKYPVVGPNSVYYWDKSQDIYNKGSAILHTLRNVIAKDEVFFRIIKKFNLQYRNRIVTTADFTSLAEKESGLDLDAFFSQYLYRRDSPLLEWNYVINGTQTYIVYRLSRAEEDLRLPVSVKQNGKTYMLVCERAEKTFLLPEGGKIIINDNASYIQVKRNNSLY